MGDFVRTWVTFESFVELLHLAMRDRPNMLFSRHIYNILLQCG